MSSEAMDNTAMSDEGWRWFLDLVDTWLYQRRAFLSGKCEMGGHTGRVLVLTKDCCGARMDKIATGLIDHNAKQVFPLDKTIRRIK